MVGKRRMAAAIGDAVSREVTAALDVRGRVEDRLDAVDRYLADTLADALDVSPEGRARLRRADLPRLADLAVPIGQAVDEEVESAVNPYRLVVRESRA